MSAKGVLVIFSFLAISHYNSCLGCSYSDVGKNAGKAAAEALSKAIIYSTHQLKGISDRLATSFDKGVDKVGEVVKELSKTLAKLAESVNIQINSADLVNIGKGAAEQLKEALIEVSKNWELAINTADLKDIGAEAAKHLSHALQNINVKVELMIRIDDNVLAVVKDTTAQLTNAINNGLDKTSETVKHLADTVEAIAKRLDFRVSSADLAHLGADFSANLKDALAELSKNWGIAINTADLKDVGSEAAKHLSEAIQNINVYMKFGIDANLMRAIGYISIAAGIAFSVLFVAILISLRGCRSCTANIFTLCIEGCKSCRNREDPEIVKNNEENKNSSEAQVVRRDKFVIKNIKRGNVAENIYNEIDDESDEEDEVSANKRLTMSLEQYNMQPAMKFWAKKDNKHRKAINK